MSANAGEGSSEQLEAAQNIGAGSLKKSATDQMLPSKQYKQKQQQQQPQQNRSLEKECDKSINDPKSGSSIADRNHKNAGANPGTHWASALQGRYDRRQTMATTTQLSATNVFDTNPFENYNDDQVLPAWPSRIEAVALEPSTVQHQVYSLKDYSQVAGPTTRVASSSSSTRLLKSMSQDRKVKSGSKRMSECIYSSAERHAETTGATSTTSSSKQRLPSMAGHMPSVEPSMGAATSVNSLLPPAVKNAVLSSESRIDRMRKLFVSPLSLRSSGSGSKMSGGHQSATSSNPRLSFQASSNVLNKPHHLMHAMYRTRVHHRRSPMRQKQGTKSFRVYGCPLHLANNIYPITCFGRPDIYQQSVPYILARLCNYIEENSSQLTHEGIFRVSGNARLMEKLRTLFDHLGDAPLESESVDVATSASMLKMYLRELPEPLIPTRMNYYFISLAKKYSSLLSKDNISEIKAFDNIRNARNLGSTEISTNSNENHSALDRQRMAFLRDLTKLVRKLPIENYNLLKYLACFLYRISLKQQYNKMCAEALGIVFGPNVFRIRSESYKGLKEQELSNQIMASIINNYKSIFDCELTDPLGNLIKSNEDLNVSKDDSGNRVLKEASQSKDTLHGRAQIGSPTRTCSPIPSGSATCVGDSNTCASTRCSKHGHVNIHSQKLEGGDDINKHASRLKGQLYPDSDEDDREDEEDDDDDGDDDDDDDEEDCDDESYSPSSSSGSYCSSMGSDSVPSTYDERAGNERYVDDNFDMVSDSSSECGSDTSYTPSSSHSGSEYKDIESPYYKSSSFESSSSFGRKASLNDTNETTTNIDQPNSGQPCRVCKRRESAQLEALNRISDNQATVSGTTRARGSVCETRQKELIHDDNLAKHETNVETKAQPGRQNIEPKSQHKTSRRKRLDEARRKPEIFDIDDKTASDNTLHRNNEQPKVREDEKLSGYYHMRQAQRYNFARRRSSSASSLLRIKKKHDQINRKKASNRDNDNQHPYHRARVHSDRRKTHVFRGYSRKSRNRNHLTRKSEHSKQSNTGSRFGIRRLTMNLDGKIDRYPVDELSALNLASTGLSRDLIWDFISTSYLESPECERFYQLRSFNSDETLLRTQDHNVGLMKQNEGRSKRRFSGHDRLQNNRGESLLPISPFSQIFEAFEGETLIDADNEHEDRGGYDHPAMTPPVEASVISLLGDRLTSFKHSVLSMNADYAESSRDPIYIQIRVTKDLIKSLKKQLKHGSTNGYSHEMATFMMKLFGDLGLGDSYFYDCSTYHIDHLTARSIVELLEELGVRSDRSNHVDRAEQDQISSMLSSRVYLLKQRYNSLKTIRDHYLRHHASSSLEGSPNSNRHANEESQTHGSLSALHQLAAERSSFGPNAGSADNDEKANQEETISDQEVSPQSRRAECGGVNEEDVNYDEFSCSLPRKNISGGSVDHHQSSPPHGDGNRSSRKRSICRFGSLCPVEFVFNIEKQLASKRISGERMVKLNEMSLEQLQSEKLDLQKNLLRYEHWFGRPKTRLEFSLIGHLYERYHVVKAIKLRKQQWSA